MSVLALIGNLRWRGVEFVLDAGILRVRVPRGVTLSTEEKEAVHTARAEISARLRSPGLRMDEIQEVFPGAGNLGTSAAEKEAIVWLRQQLTRGPRRIAEIVGRWAGDTAQLTEQRLNILLAARQSLAVEAFTGPDQRSWWRLPRKRAPPPDSTQRPEESRMGTHRG